ncbi:MAG: zinc-ribbon domain-containing protein [Promethearchaeota archaeon]
MTEEELKTDMRNLGIQKMEITPDDAIHIERVANEIDVNIKKFCMYCGAHLDSNAKFCASCGQKI